MRNLFLIFIVLLSFDAQAIRIKDLAAFTGVRDNQLVGYGLVVGLGGTGDSTASDVLRKSLGEALSRMGIGADPSKFQVKNVASVMVTATLPAFSKNGSHIDVVVNSIGDAASLQGGTLLLTPLRAPNQEVYAVAQGPVSIGGFSAEGDSGSSISKNHQTVAKIPNGGIVEKEIDFGLEGKAELTIAINKPDFTTSLRMAKRINEFLGKDSALPIDSGSIQIKVPPKYQGRIVSLIANIESLEVKPDAMAKVVVNERTGTVVMGEDVRISTVAVAHGSLSIQIDQKLEVSQPNPLSNGVTAIVPQTEIFVNEDEQDRKLVLVTEGVSIGDVIRALNAIGVTPRDLISVLQAIKAAGALQGELEVI